jgi:DNA primase
MDDTVKYLIHADVTADGVVERSDVVGAIFGQTEGLLGDQLDLRGLQQASKVGRIDVEITSEGGQSFGTVTIETSLDKVPTATLGAALETISRVGPCRARVTVTEIEDVRAAKRREVVERATELLVDGFSDTVMSSDEILEEVRERVRVEDVTEYEGLPAGPRVTDSDAIIVVEGRADVLTLLQYGVKNAVAVEGTDVPDAVAELTRDRTVTVFLDGDRGGDLILEELSQVGEVDHVAFAPAGQSVEDLDRSAVFAALQEKVPYESVAGTDHPREAVATDGSATPAPTPAGETPGATDSADDADDGGSPDAGTGQSSGPVEQDPSTPTDPESGTAEGDAVDDPASGVGDEPQTLQAHVDAVVGAESGRVRLVDDDYGVVAEAPAAEAFETVESEASATAVVLDGVLDQRTLDVAAQRGITQVVARDLGEFTKRPTSVRLRTADQLATPE